MYPIEYKWIKNPTPVMISTQISESGSSSNPKSKPRQPRKQVLVRARSCAPLLCVASPQASTVATNDAATAALPNIPAKRLSCGPKAQHKTAPASGSSQMTNSSGYVPSTPITCAITQPLVSNSAPLQFHSQVDERLTARITTEVSGRFGGRGTPVTGALRIRRSPWMGERRISGSSRFHTM